jgi:hypothetical protein
MLSCVDVPTTHELLAALPAHPSVDAALKLAAAPTPKKLLGQPAAHAYLPEARVGGAALAGIVKKQPGRAHRLREGSNDLNAGASDRRHIMHRTSARGWTGAGACPYPTWRRPSHTIRAMDFALDQADKKLKKDSKQRATQKKRELAKRKAAAAKAKRDKAEAEARLVAQKASWEEEDAALGGSAESRAKEALARRTLDATTSDGWLTMLDPERLPADRRGIEHRAMSG